MTAKTSTIKKKIHSLTNDPGEIEKKICYLTSSCTEINAMWVKDQRQTLWSENALGTLRKSHGLYYQVHRSLSFHRV